MRHHVIFLTYLVQFTENCPPSNFYKGGNFVISMLRNKRFVDYMANENQCTIMFALRNKIKEVLTIKKAIAIAYELPAGHLKIKTTLKYTKIFKS